MNLPEISDSVRPNLFAALCQVWIGVLVKGRIGMLTKHFPMACRQFFFPFERMFSMCRALGGGEELNHCNPKICSLNQRLWTDSKGNFPIILVLLKLFCAWSSGGGGGILS